MKSFRLKIRHCLHVISVSIDKMWEILLHVDFEDIVSLEDLKIDADHGEKYGPSTTRMLFNMRLFFKRIGINRSDSIIDLGCGKGKVIYHLSKCGFGHVDGVELNAMLSETARNNLKKLKVDLSMSTIFNIDADLFTDYDRYNWVYLFNPFPHSVAEKVVANLETSIARKPRTVSIIYGNPKCEDVIMASKYFSTSRAIFRDVKLFELKNTAYRDG